MSLTDHVTDAWRPPTATTVLFSSVIPSDVEHLSLTSKTERLEFPCPPGARSMTLNHTA